MSNCCTKSSHKDKNKKTDVFADNKPKSWIGKYLYELGKKDAERKIQKSHGSCH